MGVFQRFRGRPLVGEQGNESQVLFVEQPRLPKFCLLHIADKDKQATIVYA